jgi:hypothetical protein
MTKRVVIKNGDEANYDLMVTRDDGRPATIIPPNQPHEEFIHAGVTLTISEVESSEESQRRGVHCIDDAQVDNEQSDAEGTVDKETAND